ncbi:MAG TPA: OmpA family protein [Polyangiaceae bacterium]|nr:OmpA family protein [Polyangiaceae bacterium]
MRARSLFAASLATLTGLALTLHGGAASAQQVPQTTGFAVSKFEPSERGSEWFAQDSMDYRGKLRPSIGIVGEYVYRPLVIYNADGSVQNSVVRNQLLAHLGASVVLFERLRLGVNLPVALYNDGHTGTFRGTQFASPPKEQGIGDLRLALDFRVAGDPTGPLRFGVGSRFWLPTGSQENYLGDGSARVAPHLNVSGDVGILAYSARAGVNIRLRDQPFAQAAVGTELLLGGAVGLHVLDKKLMVGPEVNLATTVSKNPDGTSAAFGKRTTPVEGLFGVHYTAGPVRFGAGAGTGFTRGFGSPQARVLLNVEYQPEIKIITDRDGDGILDKDDACPDVKGVPSDDVSKHGCPPEAPKDTDRDGILDTDDACVDVPGVKTDDPRTSGCPSDKDKDGIYDKDDACVDVPGVRHQDPAKNGCPADSDGDGVIDANDACPDKPGLKSNDPKTNGCPDTDRDKDGVLNDVDACPDEPGKPDPDPKRNGCPKAFVQAGVIKILDQVKFKTASALILPGRESEEVLEAVLKVMTDHPEIKAVSVEGHTDSQGAAAKNKRLSADRAASVVKWLTVHGIDKSRLSSVGYGQEKPIDSNETPAGRQNNRRVEFHIVDEKAVPAPAATPAPAAAKPAAAKPAAAKPAAAKPAAKPAKK